MGEKQRLDQTVNLISRSREQSVKLSIHWIQSIFNEVDGDNPMVMDTS